MREHIYLGQAEDIGHFLEGLAPFPPDAFLLLEKVPDRWLGEGERETGIQLTRCGAGLEPGAYQKGRIFSPRGELRWEYRRGKYHLVYAGQEGTAPGGLQGAGVSWETSGPEGYYLWGKLIREEDLAAMGLGGGPPLYLELIIPRVLAYPVNGEGGARCKVQALLYHEPGNSSPCYFRFYDLEEVPE